jgi:glycosyltransferase involved in cell wall biosynthesis
MLKVLLIGEFSGLFNNLAEGLKYLNCDVVLANDGNPPKNYCRDIDIHNKWATIIPLGIGQIINEVSFIKNLPTFDIIQIINPGVFSERAPIKFFLKQLRRKCAKFFLTAAGDDSYYWQAFREGKFRYSPHVGTLNDYNSLTHLFENRQYQYINDLFVEYSDGVIANAAEYYIAYQNRIDSLTYIPFPIKIKNDASNFISRNSSGKIKILHGIQKNRQGFKGNKFFFEAIKSLPKHIQRAVEYREIWDLSYDQYRIQLKECDFLLDQVNSYSPGMNALEAMSYGKIVFGGCEEEFITLNNIKDPPLVNVIPDSKDIANKITKVIEDSLSMEKISKEASSYVHSNHDYKHIAHQYMKVWNL